MSFDRNGRYYTDFEDPILPSQVSKHDWLQFVIDKDLETDIDIFDIDYTGKWMIFGAIDRLDMLWPHLKTAMHQRKLGTSMKSSTSQDDGLICVYTTDWRDVDDIRRVLVTLRELGIIEKIFYKSDEQTLMGMSGSIYCSPRGDKIELTRKGVDWYKRMGVTIPIL